MIYGIAALDFTLEAGRVEDSLRRLDEALASMPNFVSRHATIPISRILPEDHASPSCSTRILAASSILPTAWAKKSPI